MEKGSWERKSRGDGASEGGKEGREGGLQTFTVTLIQSNLEWVQLYNTLPSTFIHINYEVRHIYMLTQRAKKRNRQMCLRMREDQVPVAVVCCSLCEAGTAAMCRRRGPR